MILKMLVLCSAFLTACGQTETQCVLDGHPLALSGSAKRAPGCAVAFDGSGGEASSWVDINGGKLQVSFSDTCSDTARTVTLTDEQRMVRATKVSSSPGVMLMPWHDGMVWMDINVKSPGCSTVATIAIVR